MLNFTMGPVLSSAEVLSVAGQQTPYFRTKEFSDIMFDNQNMVLEFLNAPQDSKCVFLTSSGTGAMEACVLNILIPNDKVLVINGGTFGERFVKLCQLYKIPFQEIKCEFGKQIQEQQLYAYNDQGYTALLVNMHETSSGILYDMNMISSFCKRNHMLLIVDAIGSFIADEIDMTAWNAGAIIISSQKALALHPGLAMIALNDETVYRINHSTERSMYLSLKEALSNMERGQTPYTPAVSILLQLHTRLKQIRNDGGLSYERNKICDGSIYFRNRIMGYPFDYVVNDEGDRSNAVTALLTKKKKATDICTILKDNYRIWVCPNGGEHKDKIFRVGHIGNLQMEDYDYLLSALGEIMEE